MIQAIATAHPPLTDATLLSDRALQFCDRHRRWIFIGLALIYLAAFNGQWRMEPDAALYLSLGRNLAEGNGFTYLGHPNRLAYPGWPCLIAGTFKNFGTNSLVPVHVLMMLIALATVVLTYRLVLLHGTRPTAVVVALGVGLTKTFFAYGFELWSDMPFTMGVMAFLCGCEAVFHHPKSRWYDWLLLIGGLATAIVMRPTMWPLLAAAVATLIYYTIKGKMRWPTLLGIAALGIIIAIVCFAFDPRRSSAPQQWGDQYEKHLLTQFTANLPDTLHQALTKNLPQLLSWAASDVLFQVRLGPFNAIMSLIVIALGLSLFRARILWGFWFLFLLITLLLILPLDRYFLPVIPLLVYAWWEVMVWINRKLPRPWANIVFAALIGLGCGVNISKVVGIISQQRARPFLASYDKGIFDAVPQFTQEIHQRVGDDALVLVGAPYSRVMAFLSRKYVIHAAGTSVAEISSRPVYVVEPDDENIRALLQEAHLRVADPIITVNPSPKSGPWAHPLSLCPTQPAK